MPHDPAGPITALLPPPPDVARRLTLANRLNGHVTAVGFLPQGLSGPLDVLRDELLARRGRVVAAIEARSTLIARHTQEDRDHTAGQRSAHRACKDMPADRRTAVEEREAEIDDIDEQLWSAVDVLAETSDKTIATFRRDEDVLLGSLSARMPAIADKRAAAAQLLEEAEAEEWQVRRAGQWVQQVANDEGIFSKQPYPSLVPMPAGVRPDALRDALKRPWHQDRPTGSPAPLVEPLPPVALAPLVWPLDAEPAGTAA